MEDLAELVQPGIEVPTTDKVIKRYHHTEQNLRKTLHRIADHAGVERWPKPFMCLRLSRRTELERSGGLANHVLNDWFGHSGAVAETYYLQTTEADFDFAVKQLGGPLGGPSKGRQDSPREAMKRKNPGESGVVMDPEGSRSLAKYSGGNGLRDGSRIDRLTGTHFCALNPCAPATRPHRLHHSLLSENSDRFIQNVVTNSTAEIAAARTVAK